MGFNKRYISEEILKKKLKEDGFQSLLVFVRNPDALIIEDELSQQVCDVIKENEDRFILEKLLKLNIYGKHDENG